MATPAEKLAQSLAVLKALQDAKAVAIRASDLTRVHRERLLKNGFIREVMKGWYIPIRPDGPAGESTDWYASFWPFCAAYLTERFEEDWCLGAEHSIALHSSIAGRLAGAFRNIGRQQMAETITATMRAAGYTVNETDPFHDRPLIAIGQRETSPAVNRLRLAWAQMRDPVLERFPPPPGTPADAAAYLREVDDVYAADAFNSLSIEGYRVSAELIERVRSGNWNPDNGADREHQDALAARGYWQAFQKVRDSVSRILQGANAGEVTQADHGAWYREMFGPSVTAGLLKPADLAGYRSGPVFIRQAVHVPPRSEAVRELMPAFFDLLREEREAAVRVVLGHFFFVSIHPYFDGNGRMGRFLMNAMLASGGYPWTVVPLAQRTRYMTALEAASASRDIRPFAELLGERVGRRG